jgi:hypothetical protein
MGGAGLLVRPVEALEHPRQAGGVEPLAEALLKPAAEISSCPGGDAITLRVRAAKHLRRQGRLLGLAQPLGSAGLGPVVQSRETLGVV